MNDAKYRRLFIDMDSFYASIEQMDNPKLKGKPVIVVPCLTDYTCAIAASYEAKALGIKTGTRVLDAKKKSIDLVILEAKPMRYVAVHNKLVKLLNKQVKVLSIDEMSCELPENLDYDDCDFIVELLKADIKKRIGPLTCGIGIAPNVFLAKVAAEIEKPNGYVKISAFEIQNKLSKLNITDFPGLKDKTAKRLSKVGINNTLDLIAASPHQLKRGWGSIVGIKWYYMLRGSLEQDYGQNIHDIPRTIGHSHVLPPEIRSINGAKLVFDALLSKALDRLNKQALSAGSFYIYVKIKNIDTNKGRFVIKQSGRVSHSSSPGYWIGMAKKLWNEINISTDEAPMFIELRFSRLEQVNNLTASLFDFEYEDIVLSDEYKIPERISFGDPGKMYDDIEEDTS
jgi:DNA polymerase-4